MSSELNRRNFLKTAAAVAAPAIISAQGQNNKINIGWIGVGTRGRYGLEWLKQAAPDDTQIVHICDTFDGYIDRAKATMQKTWGSLPAKFSRDYHELLADKNVDAVFIMTPEHLHKDMAVAALGAGKNIYLEKPIAHTIEEGQAVVDAWKKSGKICQIGTQNRSSGLYKKAKEWIDQGMIGEVHYARAFWYRNRISVNNSPAPAWRYEIPTPGSKSNNMTNLPAPTEQNTDWRGFLGSAPKRSWDPHRYFQWRLYWDYSNGIATDLMVHQTDIINYMCGKTTPNSVVASGGVYRWSQNDDRDAADTFSALFEYPGKFHINYSSYLGNQEEGYGEHILGSEGSIIVENRTDLYFTPETDPGADAKMKARKKIHMMNDAAPGIKTGGKSDFAEVDGVQGHFKNFVAALKGTEKPITPPPVGQEAAIGGHLATLSYKNNSKRVVWDAKTNKYSFA